MNRHLGVTGTQGGMTIHQKSTAVRYIEWLHEQFGVLHHGDCIGVDIEFHDLARQLTKWRIVSHPCTITAKRAYSDAKMSYEPKSPLERNHDIADSIGMLLVFPKGYQEELRSGTWATVRYARKRKIPIWIIYPDGNSKKDGG